MVRPMRQAHRLDPIGSDADPEEHFISVLRTSVTKLARSQRAERQRDLRALPFSLTSALSTLERLGPLTATQLAELEGVRKPSMSRALNSLEERKLVVRQVHPTDARQQVIKITPAGIASVSESRRVVDEWYESRLAQLTAKEVATIQRAVKALDRLANETL